MSAKEAKFPVRRQLVLGKPDLIARNGGTVGLTKVMPKDRNGRISVFGRQRVHTGTKPTMVLQGRTSTIRTNQLNGFALVRPGVGRAQQARFHQSTRRYEPPKGVPESWVGFVGEWHRCSIRTKCARALVVVVCRRRRCGTTAVVTKPL